jgi:hypothetical protein
MSTVGRESSILVGGTVRDGLEKNFEKTKQPKAYYLGFVVGYLPTEFFPINDFEFLDCFTAKLLWRLHARSLPGRRLLKKRGRFI